MSAVLVLHGPNLNLLGEREPELYGSMTLAELDAHLTTEAERLGIELRTHQSNHEGALIDALQDARTWAQAVIFNPGGYTHTSVALRDTILAIGIPVIEVHLTNIHGRQEFRQRSITGGACRGIIAGFGWRSYLLGLQAAAALIEAA